MDHKLIDLDTRKSFVSEKYKQMPERDVLVAFNDHFDTEMTLKQMQSFISNHRILSGRTGCFPKGNKPWNAGTAGKGVMKKNSGSFTKGQLAHNHKPIGSERINVEGYIQIKTNEPNVWELKHRVVWRTEHGAIPKGGVIRFINSDKTDVRLDNLVLVTRHENALLNKYYEYHNQPPEYKTTVILLAKIKAKTFDLSKVKKKSSRRTND